MLAALCGIGGAWMIRHPVRGGRPAWWAAAGGVAPVAYGFVAAQQADPHLGRALAAYGGVSVAGSPAWGSWPTGPAPTATTWWGRASVSPASR